MLAAGDTFRAAAVQQLEVWGKRVGADVVRGKEGADPGAVAFDATTQAKDSGADFCPRRYRGTPSHEGCR